MKIVKKENSFLRSEQQRMATLINTFENSILARESEFQSKLGKLEQKLNELKALKKSVAQYFTSNTFTI